MKLLLPALLLFTTIATAQNAHEATVKFMKAQQNAIVAEYQYPPDVAENALLEKLDKLGLGRNRSTEKGFYVYKAVNWNDLSTEKLDVYTRVDGKGTQSTLTILVSKGYDNFITSAKDKDMVDKVKAMLNSFTADANAYQLRQNIEAQVVVIAKAVKEYDRYVNDADRLEKKIAGMQKDLNDSKREIDKQKEVVDREKQKLEDMKRLAGQ